jgi:phosphoribosylanthranilate isomerase
LPEKQVYPIKPMALNTLTAVTDINNLSDARYCAAMGVDIIGFNLAPGALSPEAVLEIAGWLAGVQLAGAFAGAPAEEINALSTQCGLDLVLLDASYLVHDIAKIDQPVILQVDMHKDSYELALIELLELYQAHVKYFLITSTEFNAIDDTNSAFLAELAGKFPVLLGFGLDKDSILPVLETVNPAGIALKGGHEIKPGLKSFDELADILEVLEEE